MRESSGLVPPQPLPEIRLRRPRPALSDSHPTTSATGRYLWTKSAGRRSGCDVLRQNRLHLIDVDAFSELLLDGLAMAGNPDLHFSVHVEMSGSLNRKAMDVTVRNRRVVHLLPRHSLLVHQDQATVGEDEGIPDEHVGSENLLAGTQQPAEFLECALRVELCRVACDPAHESHDLSLSKWRFVTGLAPVGLGSGRTASRYSRDDASHS